MSGALDEVPKLVRGPGSPEKPARVIGVIGDVHAEDERLAIAIRVLRERGAELLVCVGDVADGFGDLDATIALLEREKVHVISGNHDRWFLADTMRTLRNVQHVAAHPDAERAIRLWPPLLEVATTRGTLLVCHAIGRDDMAKLDEDMPLSWVKHASGFDEIEAVARFRFVVAGHIHRFFVRKFDDFVWVNAGTLKRDDAPCFVLLDVEAREVMRFDLDEALGVSEHAVALP